MRLRSDAAETFTDQRLMWDHWRLSSLALSLSLSQEECDSLQRKSFLKWLFSSRVKKKKKKIPTGLSLYVYRIQYGTRNIYIIEETENTVRAVEMEKNIFDPHSCSERGWDIKTLTVRGNEYTFYVCEAIKHSECDCLMFLRMTQSGSGRCFVTENKKLKDQMIKCIEGNSKNNQSG